MLGDILVPLHSWTDELDYLVCRVGAWHLLARGELQDSDVDVLARLDDVVDVSRRPRRISRIATECSGARSGHDDRSSSGCISGADYREMCCTRILRGFGGFQESVILNRRGARISISARDDTIGVFGDLLCRDTARKAHLLIFRTAAYQQQAKRDDEHDGSMCTH